MDRFHNPDISVTVMRRQVGDLLMDGLFWYGRLMDAQNWHGVWGGAFPSGTACRSAVYRLRKQGLLVGELTGRFAQLALTDEGKRRLKRLHQPERMWRREWGGYWYMFMYDVPESSRHYRDVLRGFLKKQRLGCLQKSIYITPNDIRPDFADLREAIEVDQYAYLFESRTVLGLDPMAVVRDAWNWRAINGAHAWFIDKFQKKLIEVEHDLLDTPALQTLAREEMGAYVTVMDGDPLLPEPLLPQEYVGGVVLNLHRSITKAVAGKLKFPRKRRDPPIAARSDT
ncbi:MAG: hypothetical protein HN919_19070 [Verrucomicrobia bacterium]|jgi:phenylacetic acid degradation operon negative regulatory protein|nr:hypothetical protein [Verrucomicrobiota bacterium]MBT7068407.1 hypothetical protein [Verrucomicrobiota bacterium]MBT7700334.1 hypothetical protein [Verrucomicrobiota bacterium]